jgi:CHAD domain-containing protein
VREILIGLRTITTSTHEKTAAATTLGAVKETLERELKLTAGEGFILPELGGERMPTRVFVSTYHDTPDLRLARHGITFRHRVEEGAGVWQLKLPQGDARRELERAGPPGVVPLELVSLLPALLRGAQLRPVARLRTRREVVRAFGAEVVDDSVAVLDRQRVTRRFRELEVELLDGDEDALYRLESALREAGAGAAAFRPKLYQVLELDYPRRPAAVTAKTASSKALGLRLEEQVAALLSRDPGTRLGRDPEDLHQLRVATRRLRAYLRVARPLLVEERTRELRDELRWLGSMLGPVRDSDVLLEYFTAQLEQLDGAHDAGAGLLRMLEDRRAEARGSMLEALGSARYFALLDRLDGFAATPPLSGERISLAAIWWREAKRVRRAVEALAEEPSDDELHEVRILVKRARYAAELGAHELEKRGARFVSAAKSVQDVLGAHQDAVVAEAVIHEWSGEEAPVAAVLAEAERRRRDQARAEWLPAWERLWKAAKRARP